tara:strand:- start:2068 stop:3564 length:1497 start_codon:yes stop_codon:yes gene_type:complete
MKKFKLKSSFLLLSVIFSHCTLSMESKDADIDQYKNFLQKRFVNKGDKAPPNYAIGQFKSNTYRHETQAGAEQVSLTYIQVEPEKPSATQHKKYLFMIEGGPGSEGVLFVRNHWNQLPQSVKDNFTVVGINPRGTYLSAFYDELFDACEVDHSGNYTKSYDLNCDYQKFLHPELLSTNHLVHDIGSLVKKLDIQQDDDLYVMGRSYGTRVAALFAMEDEKNKNKRLVDGVILDSPMSSKNQTYDNLVKEMAEEKRNHPEQPDNDAEEPERCFGKFTKKDWSTVFKHFRNEARHNSEILNIYPDCNMQDYETGFHDLISESYVGNYGIVALVDMTKKVKSESITKTLNDILKIAKSDENKISDDEGFDVEKYKDWKNFNPDPIQDIQLSNTPVLMITSDQEIQTPFKWSIDMAKDTHATKVGIHSAETFILCYHQSNVHAPLFFFDKYASKEVKNKSKIGYVSMSQIESGQKRCSALNQQETSLKPMDEVEKFLGMRTK